MKTTTIAPVRIELQLRDAVEQSLNVGEATSGLIDKTARAGVTRRREHTAFIRRGLAAIARTSAANDGIPANAVIGRLEAKLVAARASRRA